MIDPVDFKAEVMILAKDIRVQPKEIHIREMSRKWGSCSSRGRLTFDKKLLNEPKSFRFEVIIHELLHLRYPKHGKMFNALLEEYLRKNIEKK
ncbi:MULTISPECIES: M48 family metallopeptidase [Petrotoga]|nr:MULTISPECIES: M48 family metallopeptidase [Petrotoga]PNR95694.1 hypothetical protein X929_07095 [Petrotoga olearia DSM 13574]RMA71326.1 hypothetical protein C8D75_1600 [Petrotoga olearia]TDX10911.1 hypothetical protein C8D74_11813 [Petrotoga sibirica]